jgi:DNA helicase HerA-like ATPase
MDMAGVEKGIIVGGDLSDLIVRERDGERFEIGELLVAGDASSLVLLQVYDLTYGSQISAQHRELMGGLKLEDDKLDVLDPALRTYQLAHLKALVALRDGMPVKAKSLPVFFSRVRVPTQADLRFLSRPEHPLALGNLRSGSRELDVQVIIDGKDALSHHVLIAASTGRGKSNLLKCVLWSLVDATYCGALVLDPHDEYFHDVLDHHPSRARVQHYSASLTPRPGSCTLRVNVSVLTPQHFNGVIDFSDPQRQALAQYFRKYGGAWIRAIALEEPIDGKFMEGTLAVVRRRVLQTLGLDVIDGVVACESIFVLDGAQTVIADMCNAIVRAETVIIDTSTFDGAQEILIGSLVATEILRRYRRASAKGELGALPVVTIVLEEAPRVIGREVLEQGPNIFSTIAREGRKFKVGLTAITQLPSLIPREVLANMSTKIILGMEMKPERLSLIESASQDLSTDDRAIAGLDRGEAIVTSTFVPFALPIKVPLFGARKSHARNAFAGVRLH